jgi:hypothetical protein
MNCNTKHIAVLMVVLSLTASPVGAWNETGHRIIAVLAFDALDPAVRGKAADLIRHMPELIRSGSKSDQDRWLFSQAAVWPDMARRFSGDERRIYDRPTWHYINLPLFATETDGKELQARLDLNLNRAASSDAPETTLNIMQALDLSSRQLLEPGISDEQRAVALCWVLHLIGDLHQPLHTSALFSKGRFPAGDRGGNLIKLVRGGSLHSRWDSLLGSDMKWNGIRGRAADIRMAYPTAGGTQESDDAERWLQETHAECRRAGYTKQIIDLVASHDDPSEELQLVDLNEGYHREAGAVARRQAAKAADRLAARLSRTFQ